MVIAVPGWREMLSALVEIPSISSVNAPLDISNRPIIERLAGWLEALGWQVEIMPVNAEYSKANLLATLGSGPGGLVLAGHTDTVPFDEGRWTHPPFRLTEKEDRLYGLGIADMKAFLALAIQASRKFNPQTFAAPLIFLATADEESGMSGARALLKAGRPRARYAVIGEPTGLRPVRMHKGILMTAVRVQGRSGHSSNPLLGRNALEGMHGVISEILDWRTQLQQQHRHPAFEVPYPTLNLGYIHGGDNPNRICGECELHFDLRTLPDMDPAALRSELMARLQHALADAGFKLQMTPLSADIPGMETASDSPIVRVAEDLTGQSAAAVSFATEGSFLQALGMATLILGPGDIAQAHQPDESLAVARIPQMLDVLEKLIAHFCIGGSSE